jgi:methyl-accepting chemotaxis protein
MDASDAAKTHLLNALRSLKDGNLGVRIPAEQSGIDGQIAETFNGLAEQLSALTSEINRLTVELATEGRLGGQSEVEGLSGTWQDVQNNVNNLEIALTTNIRAISNTAQLALQSGRLTPLKTLPQNELYYLGGLVHWLIRELSEKDPHVKELSS